MAIKNGHESFPCPLDFWGLVRLVRYDGPDTLMISPSCVSLSTSAVTNAAPGKIVGHLEKAKFVVRTIGLFSYQREITLKECEWPSILDKYLIFFKYVNCGDAWLFGWEACYRLTASKATIKVKSQSFQSHRWQFSSTSCHKALWYQ